MKFDYQKFLLGPHDPRKPLVGRPLIPVYLLSKTQRTPSPYFALLDSGADRVIFPADLADAVGVADIETGTLEPTVGIAKQRADVYYHELALQLLGDSRVLPTMVGFSRDVSLPILGRSFFAHFREVVFQEGKERLELRQ